MADWKAMSKTLSEMHREVGGGAVDTEGRAAVGRGEAVVNTVNEQDIETLVGNKISPKQIRRYAWENRNHRSLKRDNAIFWSVYDEEEDKTHLGMGAVVDQKTINRGLMGKHRVLING
tara:strand:- start:417 stop:770 length:354 start_codon:yes stop_codon:yes gene_type:complete